MAELVYSTIMSLDGYVADEHGDFGWAAPDEEVHAFINDLEHAVGTYLYGRRMYEVMAVWDTMSLVDEPPVMHDFAQMWRRADKVVYSTTLESVSSEKTRIEREFHPDAVRAMKATSTAAIGVGGPGLAGQMITNGLVDEVQVFVVPILVGAGTRALPDEARVKLHLLEERRFASGFAYLRYRVAA